MSRSRMCLATAAVSKILGAVEVIQNTDLEQNLLGFSIRRTVPLKKESQGIFLEHVEAVRRPTSEDNPARLSDWEMAALAQLK